MNNSNSVVNLLWTGGWDSTFRLLQLVLILKKKVQPYYIIDSNRLSIRLELLTMRNIRQQLFAENQEVKELILPTKLLEIQEISPDNYLTKSFKLIKKMKPLGDQYEWLARFAKQYNVDHLELSVVLSEDGPTKLVEEFIEPVDLNGVPTFEIKGEELDKNVLNVFKYFSFPIFYHSKIEMKDIAIKYNFYHLLIKSWFCHSPNSNEKPCGICKPCNVVMKTGMQFRMPFFSRQKYYFRYLISRKHFISRFSGYMRFIRAH